MSDSDAIRKVREIVAEWRSALDVTTLPDREASDAITALNRISSALYQERPGASRQCCCGWGAAVSGEYPEFGCALCPIHQAALGETELCRRHRLSWVCRIPDCGCDGTWHA